jgi:hypothetical protein
VLPQARKLRELGAGGRDEIEPPVRLDLAPRAVAAIERDAASDAAG